MLSVETNLESGNSFLPKNFNGSPNQLLLPLTSKVDEKNRLIIGGCDVTTLVERFGSPLYIVDEETLRSTCRQYREAFAK